MVTLFRILLVLAVHGAFWFYFPETGPGAAKFFALSAAVWCVIAALLGIGGIFRSTGFLSRIISFAFALIVIVGLTMPQKDDVSPLEKIRRHYLPRTAAQTAADTVLQKASVTLKHAETDLKKAVKK